MKKTEFNKILKENTEKKSSLLDNNKIKNLDNDVKNAMILYIVRKRMPILNELLNDETDMSWLHSMGYLYETQGKKYKFLHTIEHRIK